eukprot:7183190-Prymnesium_polylepis.1
MPRAGEAAVHWVPFRHGAEAKGEGAAHRAGGRRAAARGARAQEAEARDAAAGNQGWLPEC